MATSKNLKKDFLRYTPGKVTDHNSQIKTGLVLLAIALFGALIHAALVMIALVPGLFFAYVGSKELNIRIDGSERGTLVLSSNARPYIDKESLEIEGAKLEKWEADELKGTDQKPIYADQIGSTPAIGGQDGLRFIENAATAKAADSVAGKPFEFQASVCENCSAPLRYDPCNKRLHCDHCGSSQYF